MPVSSSDRSTPARSTTSSPRPAGSKGPAAGCRGPTGPRSSASSGRWWPSLAEESGTTIDLDYQLVRDAFFLDQQHPFVATFQHAYEAIAGRPLPLGPKPFVDDGNSFSATAGVPAITHGPRAGGQHTVEEWASIDDLVRVAHLYALTAILYCPQD